MASYCSRAQSHLFLFYFVCSFVLPPFLHLVPSFIFFSQPSSDGELRLARSVTCFLFYFILPAVLGWRASAHALSCVCVLFILFSQPSSDGELWLARSVASFFLFFSFSQPSSDGRRLPVRLVALFRCFFLCLSHPWTVNIGLHAHTGGRGSVTQQAN